MKRNLLDNPYSSKDHIDHKLGFEHANVIIMIRSALFSFLVVLIVNSLYANLATITPNPSQQYSAFAQVQNQGLDRYIFVGGWGDEAAIGNFSVLAAIAVDPSSGNVYVADTYNAEIKKFTSNGTFISKWGEYGKTGERLNAPSGIAVDPSSGNVYVADTYNAEIKEFTNNGTFISKWGSHGKNDGQLNSPSGISLDESGNIYVADTGNNQISIFTNNGTFIATFGTYGINDGQMRYPSGISVDTTGNL